MHRSMVRSTALTVVILLAAGSALCGQEQAPLTFGQATPTVPNDAAPPAYGQPAQADAVAPPVNGSQGPVQAPPAAQPALPGADPGQAGVGSLAPPFVLTNGEQQYVVQTLQMWENESAKVKTFNADFERLEYDAVWNPGSEQPMIVSTGVVSYSKPDKGSFKIDKISRWTKTDPKNPAPDAPGAYVEQKEEIGEHWVCDGKAIYEYDELNKQLKVTPIPVEMRGAQISDGPLPFLFGAQAQKLMERYWIRPEQSDPAQIRLSAFPRRQIDAANYDFVEIILDRKTMQPVAMQVHLPGGQQRHVYKFQTPTINGKMEALFGGLFNSPRTPIGWKRVIVADTELPPGPQAANPSAPQRQ